MLRVILFVILPVLLQSFQLSKHVRMPTASFTGFNRNIKMLLSPHDIIDSLSTLSQLHPHIITDHIPSLLLSADDISAGSDVVTNTASAAVEAASPYSKIDKTGVIGFIASYVEIAIDGGHTLLQNLGVKYSYGFSIIIFTLFVKALTLPLTTKQLESTTKMQQLTPYTQKIQKVYANDEQTRNQLTAQLFQTANVNPLAGCFPALVQIPIFISLYRALQNLVAENKLAEPFLWIPDLEGPVYSNPPSTSLDWLKSVFSGAPTLGWHDTLAFLSLPVILYVSQSISMKILQPPKDPTKVLTEQEQVSQGILNQLPFIVAFFAVNVPAGLSVYWIINNIMTTVITVVVKAQFAKIPVPVEVAQMMATVDAVAAGGTAQKSKGKGPSGAMTELAGQRKQGAVPDGKVSGFSASSSNIIDAEVGSVATKDGEEEDYEDDDEDDAAKSPEAALEGLSKKRQKAAKRAAEKKRK